MHHGRHLLTVATAQPAGAGGDPLRLRGVLIAAALAMFVIDLDFFAFNLALPAMAEELDTSVTDIQWVVSGYMLALAAFFIPGGRLGDILGRKRMLLAGFAIFGVAALACGLAPSAEILIAFRIVQGIGAALMFPLLIAVITNAFPEERRTRAIGNVYGLGALATAIGPFFGGALTELIDWRAVFIAIVPITAAGLVLTVRAVEESRDSSAPRHIDLTGLVAVVLGIAAITFAIDRSEGWGWASAATIGMLAGGALLMAAFVVQEGRSRWPLVDLSLFRNAPFVIVTALGTVANVTFAVTTYATTLYLQRAQGYSPLEAGLIFAAASVAVAFSGPLSGRLGERFDIPRTMAVSSVFGGAGLLVASLVSDLGVYMPALAVFGLGFGLGWSLVSIGTQAVVPKEEAGVASGVTLAIVVGAGGLGIAAAATIIESVAGGGTGLGTAIEDVLRAVAIGAAVAAVGLVAVAAWARRRLGER